MQGYRMVVQIVYDRTIVLSESLMCDVDRFVKTERNQII